MKILKILETVKNFIKKNKKLVTVVSAMFCAVVLVAGSIAGTIAYLTSTAQVTNTFTVGNVKITMDEAKVDLYGVAEGGRTTSGNKYKLIPGHTYTKDPLIKVDANSENCYLFVEVVNGIKDVEVLDDSDPATIVTIKEQLATNGWVNLSGNIWYYNQGATNGTKVTAGASIPTFASFTLKDNADVSALADGEGNVSATVVITAYAVQADGFASAEAAWTATFGAPTT